MELRLLWTRFGPVYHQRQLKLSKIPKDTDPKTITHKVLELLNATKEANRKRYKKRQTSTKKK